MTTFIRQAHLDDASAIQDIYQPFVEQTAVSFETQTPSVEELQRRIQSVQQRHPWLVWDEAGVKGYAYAAPHRSRSAYQWSAEVSIYLSPDCRRRGIGRQLYGSLLQLLRNQGVASAFAGITLPNPQSVAFHRSIGFEPIGVYSKVGWKHGAWHDVSWSQLRLLNTDAPPAPLQPVDYSVLDDDG